MNLRVADESEIPIPTYQEPAQFGWKEFYKFRNYVIEALRRFGTAGPCGLANLTVADDEAPVFEDLIIREPNFFVVDDMWNSHDRMSLVEADLIHINLELIEALAETGTAFPGWCVVLKLGDCGLDICADKVVARGRRFWNCQTVAEIAFRCSAPVDYGPRPPFQEAMYPLWLAVVSGHFESAEDFAPPPDHQWHQAIRALEEIKRAEESVGALNSFSYDRIRCDLHPHTRLLFTQHFLDELSTYEHKRVEEARRNILRDAGEALASSQSSTDRELLVKSISAAQKTIGAWFKPVELIFWWPYVHSAIGEPDEELKSMLGAEFRALLNESNSWIQLSGLFGLALLGESGIAEIVDRATLSNPNWLKNAELRTWLLDMKAGSAMYPSLRGERL